MATKTLRREIMDNKNRDALLTEIDHLHHEDAQLRRSMEAGFGAINTRLDGLAQTIQASGKTNWNATAVLLTFIGMVGTLVYIPIDRELERNRSAIQDHLTLPGHTQAMILHAHHEERFDRHQQHLNSIDVEMKRIEDAKAVEHDKIIEYFHRTSEALDERLQLEMRLLQAAQDEKIAALGERIENVDKFGSRRWMTPNPNQETKGPKP